MSALDTNVLIRYLVGDVPEQTEADHALIDELTPDEPGNLERFGIIDALMRICYDVHHEDHDLP